MEKTKMKESKINSIQNDIIQKRRGRPPKHRDSKDENDQKRPRGRPKNSIKPSAAWCSDSVKLLFELRYDSTLRQKFEERDNRAKRTGYELLASTLSDAMGRKFDNTQVQQKLSQLHVLWTKYDQNDEEITSQPAYYDIMLKYWGPRSIRNESQSSEPYLHDSQAPSVDKSPHAPPQRVTISTDVPSDSSQNETNGATTSITSVTPNMKLRRLLSKQAETDDNTILSSESNQTSVSHPQGSSTTIKSAGPGQSKSVSSRSMSIPSTKQSNRDDTSILEPDTLTSGFKILKDGLVAISSAIAQTSPSSTYDANIQTLIATVEKQTIAIQEQSKQIEKLVSIISGRE